MTKIRMEDIVGNKETLDTILLKGGIEDSLLIIRSMTDDAEQAREIYETFQRAFDKIGLDVTFIVIPYSIELIKISKEPGIIWRLLKSFEPMRREGT